MWLETSVFLCFCIFTTFGGFMNEVINIEDEINEKEPVTDPDEVEKIKTHLNSYYSSSCPPLETVAYDHYFTEDLRFNTAGSLGIRLVEELDLGNVTEAPPKCNITKFKVRDVEVKGTTAIAMVTGLIDLGPKKDVEFVKVHELVRNETGAWKSDICLLFSHVNFSDEVSHDHKKEEQEIRDEIYKLYDQACHSDYNADKMAPYMTTDALQNLGGKKLPKGLAGAEQGINETHAGGCMVEERRVVDVEVYNGTAIALVVGHAQQNKHRHPFILALELVNDPDGTWKIDIIVLFLKVETVPQ